MGLIAERFFPPALGIIAAGTYFAVARGYDVPATVHDLFTAMISISSIAVGFFATAKAIVVSIEEKKTVIKKLKQLGYYDDFLAYLSAAIHWSFALAILSAVGLLVDFEKEAVWRSGALTIWIAVMITAAASYYRVVRILNLVLR
jgi:hypothetical protein